MPQFYALLPLIFQSLFMSGCLFFFCSCKLHGRQCSPFLRPRRADAQGIECFVLDIGLKMVEFSSTQPLPMFFTLSKRWQIVLVSLLSFQHSQLSSLFTQLWLAWTFTNSLRQDCRRPFRVAALNKVAVRAKYPSLFLGVPRGLATVHASLALPSHSLVTLVAHKVDKLPYLIAL